MKAFLYKFSIPTIFIVIIITSCSDPKVTSSEMITERSGIYFFENSKAPFTGKIIDYHDHETIKTTGNFIDGRKQGLWETFSDNGNLRTRGKYSNGVKEGLWETFFLHTKDANPIKEFEEYYTDGKKHGIFKRWEKDGKNIRERTVWAEGLYKESIEFGNGRIKRKKFVKDNYFYDIKYPLDTYDEEYRGKINCTIYREVELYLDHDYWVPKGDYPLGNYTTSHTDGKDTRGYTWKNCQKNGVYKKKNSSGFLIEEGFYVDHKLTGKLINYEYTTGEIRKIQTYKNGKLDGLSQYFYDKTQILEREEKYKNGFLEETRSLTKKGKVSNLVTFTKDGKYQKTRYTNFYKEGPVTGHQAGQPNNHLFDFFDVMGGGIWIYVNKECKRDGPGYESMKDFDNCIFGQKLVYEADYSPIKIKTSYVGGIQTTSIESITHSTRVPGQKHGVLEISDPEDGHVYTRVDYFRDGKLGEYKVTNKDGLVVYSVNCLKGGSDFTHYSYPQQSGGWANKQAGIVSRREAQRLQNRFLQDATYSGNCRKDGEEIKYIRSPFTKNKDWYLFSKLVYKNDKVISYEYYKDPFRREQPITNTLNYNTKILILN